MDLFKIEDLFYLFILRQRICAEIEQISPNIIERSVQSVGVQSGGGQIQHLRYTLLLTLDVCLFLFEVS
jgi:hypothetical protein